jgi:hypothetical protein
MMTGIKESLSFQLSLSFLFVGAKEMNEKIDVKSHSFDGRANSLLCLSTEILLQLPFGH